MKKILTLFAIVICLNTKAQYITIPDTVFVSFLQSSYPLAMNGNQLDATNSDITTLTNLDISYLGMTDLTGIQYFSSLINLNCSYNYLTTISNLPNSITQLDCSSNSLTTIVSLPSSLTYLNCEYNNHIATLPSPLPGSLFYLNCGANALTNLPPLPNSLKFLNCGSNSISNLPTLPPLLTTLSCHNNSISILPALPNSLVSLICNSNHLTTLPALPNSLINLNCSSNHLTALPAITSLLRTLDCGYNSLTNIPALPYILNYLNCPNNQLVNLPTLSDSLTYLNCSNNQLINLPNLPKILTSLFCQNNQLVSLPALSDSLITLYCSQNSLTSLPAIPNAIQTLVCDSNQIACFPVFPNTNAFIYIPHNPFTCLPNFTSGLYIESSTYIPLCVNGNLVTNPYGCKSGQGITGCIYNDKNANCIKDSGDVLLPNVLLKLRDSGNNIVSQTFSDVYGNYSLSTSILGAYTISMDTTNKPYTKQCSQQNLDSLITLTGDNPIDTGINFALTCKPGFDIGFQSIVAGPVTYGGFHVFPGFQHGLSVNAGFMNEWFKLNCNGNNGIGGQIQFTIGGPVTYIGPGAGALTPVVSGNVYTYNISDFNLIDNTTNFKIILLTDTTAQWGDSICVTATVSSVLGDNNLSNNHYQFCYNVGLSHDPNFKEVYPIDVAPNFTDWLTYTIHFQNTGTAAAQNIYLIDTLDNKLDANTFEVINYSHANKTFLNGRIISFNFPGINLPDSTSNLAASTGFIQYRIKPKANWQAGTQIKNTAYIYFDYNTPIITNTTVNSILSTNGINELNNSNPVLNIYPNPSNGQINVVGRDFISTIKITDILGNTVYENKTINNTNANVQLNQSGVYFISINSANKTIIKKIIIQ